MVYYVVLSFRGHVLCPHTLSHLLPQELVADDLVSATKKDADAHDGEESMEQKRQDLPGSLRQAAGRVKQHAVHHGW